MGSQCVNLAVADAGPLIHLDEIDAFNLLSTIDTLLIPQTVYQELETGGIPQALETVEYDLVDTEAEESSQSRLDPGETAALSIATDREAVLLTDDLEARDAAKEANVEVHGSVGIIVFAYSRGQLSKPEAVTLIRSLQTETSLFITDAVVDHGIKLLEQAD